MIYLAVVLLWLLLALLIGMAIGRAARLGDEHPRK